MFISEGHCWAAVAQNGTARIGIDDFGKKLIGKIDDIEFPNLGMSAKQGEPLFSVKQGRRTIAFNSPLSGKVAAINSDILENLESMDISPYEKNWICKIDADNLDTELQNLKIGKTAVTFYQNELDLYRDTIKKAGKLLEEDKEEKFDFDKLFVGQLETMEDKEWYMITNDFFKR